MVPIAGDIGKGAFEVVAADTDGEAAAKGGWRLEISGGSYNEVPQKARVEMRCEKGAKEVGSFLPDRKLYYTLTILGGQDRPPVYVLRPPARFAYFDMADRIRLRQ